MKFKKYDRILEEIGSEFIELEIYYSVKLNIDLSIECGKAKEDIEKLVSLIKEAYLKNEMYWDIGFITDIACENIEEILANDNFTKWDLISKCSEAL